MSISEQANSWVSRNFPNVTLEEKERLGTAFIAGAAAEQREYVKVQGDIEGDWRNQEDKPYDIYAVSDSLELDGEIKYGDKVLMLIKKLE